jgi:hypothetical protein
VTLKLLFAPWRILAAAVAAILASTPAFAQLVSVTGSIPTRATQIRGPGSVANTSSTSLVMSGLGSTLSITPLVAGRAELDVLCGVRNNVAPALDSVQIYYGTGTAPAAGAAATGAPILASPYASGHGPDWDGMAGLGISCRGVAGVTRSDRLCGSRRVR